VEVVSGHGSFNEHHLEVVERRKKSATFKVPLGVTIVMYAPAGAALENDVANLIEKGTPPTLGDLVLKAGHSSSQTKPIPTPYPYRFTVGDDVINYTVSPPDRLNVMGKPYIVSSPKSLKKIVDELSGKGSITIHYACCSSAYSDSPTFAPLFKFRGYYIDLKR